MAVIFKKKFNSYSHNTTSKGSRSVALGCFRKRNRTLASAPHLETNPPVTARHKSWSVVMQVPRSAGRCFHLHGNHISKCQAVFSNHRQTDSDLEENLQIPSQKQEQGFKGGPIWSDDIAKVTFKSLPDEQMPRQRKIYSVLGVFNVRVYSVYGILASVFGFISLE